MTREQEIEQILFEQELEEVGCCDNEDNVDKSIQLTDEMDYYPEDDFEADQRNHEFGMIDPVFDDHSDE